MSLIKSFKFKNTIHYSSAFLRGFSTVLDIGASSIEFGSGDPAITDRNAILDDWIKVGDDMRAAIEWGAIENIKKERKSPLYSNWG